MRTRKHRLGAFISGIATFVGTFVGLLALASRKKVPSTTRVHYVTFLSPGSFTSEESQREIQNWDPAGAFEMAKTIQERHGAIPYAFSFSTMLTAPDVDDGEGGVLKVQPRTVERSGRFFINGKVLTIEDIEARADKRDEILLSNMRSNWPVVVETSNGFRHTAPFEADDAVVGDRGEILVRGDSSELTARRAQWNAAKEAEAEAYRVKYEKKSVVEEATPDPSAAA